MSESKTISVEIAPNCNFECPGCVNGARLFDKRDKRSESNLADLICEYVPQDSSLVFAGLGETLNGTGQRRIEQILNTREDINACAQTNGTFQLNDGLVDLIENRRLGVGISTDSHHIKGNEYGFGPKIQKELISAASVAVSPEDDEFVIQGILNNLEEYPHLNRVLYDPFIENVQTHNPTISTS